MIVRPEHRPRTRVQLAQLPYSPEVRRQCSFAQCCTFGGPPRSLPAAPSVEVPVAQCLRGDHCPVQDRGGLGHGALGRVHDHAEQVQPPGQPAAVEPPVPVEEGLQEEVEAVDVAQRALAVWQAREGPRVVGLAGQPKLPHEHVVRVLGSVEKVGVWCDPASGRPSP